MILINSFAVVLMILIASVHASAKMHPEALKTIEKFNSLNVIKQCVVPGMVALTYDDGVSYSI